MPLRTSVLQTSEKQGRCRLSPTVVPSESCPRGRVDEAVHHSSNGEGPWPKATWPAKAKRYW